MEVTDRVEARQAPSSWQGTLEDIDRFASEGKSIDQILKKALSSALQHTGAQRGFVVVQRPKGLEQIASVRTNGPELSKSAESPSRSIVDRAVRNRRPVRIADARHDPELEGVASVREQGIRSAFCLPLRAGGTTVGAIYLDHTQKADLFDEKHELEISQLTYRMALQVENAELKLGRRQGAPAADRRITGDVRTFFPAIVSQSAEMEEVLHRIETYGRSEEPVLITGETGVGKELVARALHQVSRRRDGPFTAVDCGSLSPTLLASELFGHVRGAFTGADGDRAGLIERANGGTLFLDEVSNMPEILQVSLLRCLQEREVRPVGSTSARKVNVRVLSGTNRPLEHQIASGRFRQDLYYRLRVTEISVPPLRDRREDIPLLARTFFEQALGSAVPTDQEVYMLLREHDWPGNVRELRAVVQELALRGGGQFNGALVRTVLRERAPAGQGFIPSADLNLKRAREKLESVLIEEAMRRTGGNRAAAAALVGVDRTHFYRLVKSLHLDHLLK